MLIIRTSGAAAIATLLALHADLRRKEPPRQPDVANRVVTEAPGSSPAAPAVLSRETRPKK